MKLIPLTQGHNAIVDDADYEWLCQWRWSFSPRGDRRVGYAYRRVYIGGGRCRIIHMHRAILGIVDDLSVVCDHRNGVGTDNRRSNLRACTQTENLGNQRKCSVPTSSQYKGVSWRRRDGRWEARLRCCGRQLFLGTYLDEADAARAYNHAALKHFGEFAQLNQIPVADQSNTLEVTTMQRLLRARELSAETGIPVSTLHHWAKADRIPHVRIDGFVRFPEHEVEAWIRERTRGGEATEGRSA